MMTTMMTIEMEEMMMEPRGRGKEGEEEQEEKEESTIQATGWMENPFPCEDISQCS